MTNYFFNVLTRGIEDGANKLVASATTVYRGMLADWPSGGSLEPSTGSTPYGQFHDYLREEEYPTVEALESFLAGKEINVVTGEYLALIGPALFEAGTIPAIGAVLYPGTSAGLIAVSEHWVGVSSVGKCVAHHTVADFGGAGSFTAARCLMTLPVIV